MLRSLPVLVLAATACAGRASRHEDAPAAGASPTSVPVPAVGSCDAHPRPTSVAYCADAVSRILVRGDGEDAVLSGPNPASGEPYRFSLDDTCGNEHWELSACDEATALPCLWIDSMGKDNELCGVYQDRSGTTFSLTQLREGLPSDRNETMTPGSPSYPEVTVQGELEADFADGPDHTLSLTLVLELCGPRYSRCCLC